MFRRISLMIILLLAMCMILVGFSHGFRFVQADDGAYYYKDEPISFKKVADSSLSAELVLFREASPPSHTYSCALVSDNAIVKASDIQDLRWSIDGQELDNLVDLIAIEAIEWGDDIHEHQIEVEFFYNGEKKKYFKKVYLDKKKNI